MRKNIGTAVTICLLTIFSAHADEFDVKPMEAPTSKSTLQLAHWAVDFELFGPGALYTWDFSYRINRNWALTTGLSIWNIDFFGAKTQFDSFPLYASYYVSGGEKSLELLAGFTYWNINYTGSDVLNPNVPQIYRQSLNSVIPMVGAGYSYRPFDGGFHLRTTLYFFTNFTAIRPWFGFSFGYAF